MLDVAADKNILLDCICELNENLLANKSIQSLFDSAVHLARKFLHCENSALILLSAHEKMLKYKSSSGIDKRRYADIVLKLGEGVPGSVVQNGSPMIVNNLHMESVGLERIMSVNNSKACLAVPVKLSGKTVGALEARGRLFDCKQIPILEILAAQISLALLISQREQKNTLTINNVSNQNEICKYKNIITRNKNFESLLKKAEKIASVDSPVLISGESGTGKELFANKVHYDSSRKNGPIVCVNCAALSQGIFESELFGHVGGAFTDASQSKIGYFEQANGGTLFLDEISELSPNIQSSLLRVLSDGYYYPVGAENGRKVDIRLITASNRDLLSCVKNGEFREDLYYRLAVLFIEIPPLRKRPDDIELLAEYFIREFSREKRIAEKKLSMECLSCMLLYQWPGNVRELRNVIQRIMITMEDDCNEIMPKDLNITTSSLAFDYTYDLKASSNSFKRKLINEVLKVHKDNKTSASKALGIQRTYLSRIIKELNIGGNI